MPSLHWLIECAFYSLLLLVLISSLTITTSSSFPVHSLSIPTCRRPLRARSFAVPSAKVYNTITPACTSRASIMSMLSFLVDGRHRKLFDVSSLSLCHHFRRASLLLSCYNCLLKSLSLSPYHISEFYIVETENACVYSKDKSKNQLRFPKLVKKEYIV